MDNSIINLENRATALEYRASVTESKTSTLESKVTTLESSVKASILDLVYPVGSIYMSIKNVSPQTFLGGKWSSWANGKMPIGYNASDSLFNTPESTGGSKTSIAPHTHNTTSSKTGTLTIYHACYNDHAPSASGLVSAGSSNMQDVTLTGSGGSKIKKTDLSFSMPTIESAGTANGNLPPYITCYMWKRTS